MADGILCTTEGIWPSEYGLWYDPCGLHVYYPEKTDTDKQCGFVQTVADNMKFFTKQQIEGALKVCHLYKTLAYPSRWLGRKVRSNCSYNVWLPCVVLWTMVALLLYYKKFVKSLKSKGFKLYPCDPYVAYKLRKVEQLTVFFHLEDCKISHISFLRLRL